jgi:hypothetical protein
MVKTTPRTASAIASALAIAALVGSASPIAAQDPSFTPEQLQELQDKATKLQEFLANQDTYLPTVNVMDAASLPVTFPYTEIQDHVVVDVAFGDNAALPFMFDTGAGTLVSREVQEANASELVIETIGLAGGGKFLITPTRRYPSLTVADAVTVTDVLASDPWEPGEAFHCITPNGLLGASSMAHGVWQVDYGTKHVSVASSVDQLEHIDGAIKLPFTINEQNKMSPSPKVRIPVGTGEIEFIVDTGGGIPMTIGPADLAAVGVELPADSPTFVTLTAGAGGQFQTEVQYTRVPVTFGDTELSVPVAVSPGMAPGAGGNIGHGFLKNFVATFDFPNQMLYLDPLFEGTTVPDPADPPAIGFGLSEGTLVVTSLAKGGTAEQAGAKLGEVVTKVDGTSVGGITVDDFCAAYANGGTYTGITTSSGTTYDASPIADFWAAMP